MIGESTEQNVDGTVGEGTLETQRPVQPLSEQQLLGEIKDATALRIEQYDRDEADKEDPELPQGESNVRLAKSREQDALPAGRTNISNIAVIVPKKAQQLQGFYTPHANVFVHQFPQYKFIQQKGQPNTQKPTV